MNFKVLDSLPLKGRYTRLTTPWDLHKVGTIINVCMHMKITYKQIP